jgi:large subunit ribosomal protein L7/L12
LIEARKVQALIKGKRSTDTRRKILAGALVLDMMERDEDTKKRFNNLLNKFITRPDDRALFDLPPLPLPVAEKQRQLPQ